MILFSHFHRIPSVYAAQQTIRVSPVIINVTLSPGKTVKDTITIENLTNTPLPLHATLNDFISGGEEGGYTFPETKTNPLLSWITMDTSDVLLNPHEKKKVKLTITTPKAIPVGGYYGMLFFEPVTQSSAARATQVQSKIGLLMLANIGVPDPHEKRAEIPTFETNLFSNDGNLPFLLRVQNVSLNFFTAKPQLVVTPLLPFTKSIQRIPLEEKVIFPGKIRRWEDTSSISHLSPNIYSINLNVSMGNGQSLTVKRMVIIFPFYRAAMVIGVFSLILFLIVKRKRLRAAIREILSPVQNSF